MTLTTIDLTPKIGAEIRTDRKSLLSGTYASAIRDILEKRGVVIFREVNLTDAEQVVFSSTLGEVIPQGEKGIFKVTMDEKENRMAEYLKAAIFWHIDGSTDDVPTRASLLSARRVSPSGGQTEFCNTYAAFEELPRRPSRRKAGDAISPRVTRSCGRTVQDASRLFWVPPHPMWKAWI